MTDPLPRTTDITPEDMGEATHFVIKAIGSDKWVVFAYWNTTDPSAGNYDGRGYGRTIEEAINAAIEDMQENC